MIHSRIIALNGVHNFRDYGGYTTADGGKLRNGLLFRSGQHARATDDDLGTIGSIPFATVIDLRGGSERDSHAGGRRASRLMYFSIRARALRCRRICRVIWPRWMSRRCRSG